MTRKLHPRQFPFRPFPFSRTSHFRPPEAPNLHFFIALHHCVTLQKYPTPLLSSVYITALQKHRGMGGCRTQRQSPRPGELCGQASGVFLTPQRPSTRQLHLFQEIHNEPARQQLPFSLPISQRRWTSMSAHSLRRRLPISARATPHSESSSPNARRPGKLFTLAPDKFQSPAGVHAALSNSSLFWSRIASRAPRRRPRLHQQPPPPPPFPPSSGRKLIKPLRRKTAPSGSFGTFPAPVTSATARSIRLLPLARRRHLDARLPARGARAVNKTARHTALEPKSPAPCFQLEAAEQ